MLKETLLTKIAKNAADVDDLVVEKQPAIYARQKELLRDPSKRDRDLWENLMTKSGLDPKKYAAATVQGLNSTLLSQRGPTWRAVHDNVWAIARRQAELELINPALISLAIEHSRAVSRISRKIDKSTAIATAIEGPGDRIALERQRREAAKNGD